MNKIRKAAFGDNWEDITKKMQKEQDKRVMEFEMKHTRTRLAERKFKPYNPTVQSGGPLAYYDDSDHFWTGKYGHTRTPQDASTLTQLLHKKPPTKTTRRW